MIDDNVYFVAPDAAGEDPDPGFDRELAERVARRMGAARDLEQLMGYLLDTAAGICGADRVSVAFEDESGQRLVSKRSAATYSPMLLTDGFSQELTGSSLAAVIETGKIRVIRDLGRYLDEHPDSASTRLLGREGVRSSMTCPLTVDDRRVGVLFRSSRRTEAFGPGAVRAHLVLAERIGQVVEKAYRIDQLEAANQAYMEMLGFVVHELKSPLANIVSRAQVMLEGYMGEMEDRQRKALGQMVGSAEYLLGLIGDYLSLARVDGGQIEAEPRDGVDVAAEIIGPAVDLSAGLAAERGITVRMELPGGPVAARCDPGLLQVAAVNLVGNAVKYADDGGTVRITISPAGDGVRVAVWNSGPGFLPEQKDRLFRRFSRIRTEALMRRKGTGVGLYTAARIVRMHGGRIGANSAPGEWAEFWFEIP